MAFPTTREEFKDNCLRRLGAPVIEINVDPDQIDDRVDEALSYYWDYHFDGADVVYIAHQIDANTIANRYIEMPDNVIGVTEIFDVGFYYSTNSLFNVRYQLVLNDLYDLARVDLSSYVMNFQYLQMMEEILVGSQPIRYTRTQNRLYLDMDFEMVSEGQYLMIKAHQVVDPATYADVWKDRWLLRYAAALIKRQWGSNLTKFEGMQLPGGVTFNGLKIYDDAVQEIEKLEEEMITNYSIPPDDMIG